MLKIRLARIGKKKQPTYRFIVSESGRDVYGKALEILGRYNPFTKVCEVKKDRILYWISKGAQPSPTVHNLLVDQNVITAPKVKASKAGKKAEVETPAPVQAAVPAATETPAASAPAETAPVEEPKVEAPKEEAKPAEAEVKVEGTPAQ
ncbi:MAG: 30S ribosomal protein S16 [Patescibacteria group bacterium]|jgi:small subunit ribosomal protein S16